MKEVIRITEGQLYRVIRECINEARGNRVISMGMGQNPNTFIQQLKYGLEKQIKYKGVALFIRYYFGGNGTFMPLTVIKGNTDQLIHMGKRPLEDFLMRQGFAITKMRGDVGKVTVLYDQTNNIVVEEWIGECKDDGDIPSNKFDVQPIFERFFEQFNSGEGRGKMKPSAVQNPHDKPTERPKRKRITRTVTKPLRSATPDGGQKK